MERRNFRGWQNGSKFDAWIAHISKITGRPTKLTLAKDQELAFLNIKPANIIKFKVGATKDGKIIACQREFHVNSGARIPSVLRRTTPAVEVEPSYISMSFRTGEK